MSQLIIESRFKAEQAAALELAEASDILDLQPLGLRTYLAIFHCKTYVRGPQKGTIETADRVDVGIALPEDYLTRPPDPAELLTCFAPLHIWHPNVHPPHLCIGPVRAGEPLPDILYRIYEVLSFQNYATLEYDCLRREACAWARRNPQRFPADERPLKRRDFEPGIQACG